MLFNNAVAREEGNFVVTLPLGRRVLLGRPPRVTEAVMNAADGLPGAGNVE